MPSLVNKQPSTKEKIIVVILLGISFLYFGGCWKLKLGAWSNPGPGFVPFIIGISLFVSCSIKFYQVYFPKKNGVPSLVGGKGEEKNYWAVYGLLLSIILYPILLGYLQFLITTILVLFALFVLLKYKTPVFSLFLAVIIASASFFIFARLLGVSLPSGTLEEIFYAIGR
jgi:putative tricarboxylic transport membrane protein